ncbi:cytochrome b/b6 domain-containing protein, partial [Pseudomonas aeruginosa]|uniref:cytochrome b/b6 domain-containing protein n=2 Tax=Pseudomonas aeruginosa TaxID=287 RepID=UPI000A8C7F74
MTNPTPKTPLLPFVRVLVWDAPLRVCHALMVACFTGTYLTGEQEEWRKVHATLGCTLSGLVVFRIVWGFMGTRYARFTNFLKAPGAIARQLRQLPHGWAKRHIGHSPVGALFYVVLLVSMLVAGASGWATSGTAADGWLNALYEVAANVTLAVGGLY